MSGDCVAYAFVWNDSGERLTAGNGRLVYTDNIEMANAFAKGVHFRTGKPTHRVIGLGEIPPDGMTMEEWFPEWCEGWRESCA